MHLKERIYLNFILIFLTDPVIYLIDKKVERVILLEGGEEGDGSSPDEINPSLPDKDKNKYLVIKQLFDVDNGIKEKIIEQENRKWEELLKEEKLIIKKHHDYATAIGVWFFRFFNYKVPLYALREFEECIKARDKKLNHNKIKEIIKNKEVLKNLRDCYKSIKKNLRNDFNNTSLVLYHGPVGKPTIKNISLHSNSCCFCCFRKYNVFFRLLNNSKLGQFLTGDINLNLSHNDIIKHYSSCLKNIIAAQVPHHGAKKNWNVNMIKDLPNNKFFIISAGIEDKYGHPSSCVILDIISNNKECLWANEINHIAIKGHVSWDHVS